MNTARDTWEDATKAGKGKHGGERRDGPLLPTQARRQNDAGFRFQSLGVLLTYQKFADTGPWDAFLEFVRGHLEHWQLRYRCATMETNADETRHLHLRLQFSKAWDRNFDAFTLQGVRPNGAPNELVGEGLRTQRLQLSLDRAFF